MTTSFVLRRSALGVLLAIVPALQAQMTPSESAADRAARFVERARVATERFKDLSVAIAESYLKVGPDFPAMGEHWVNGELIMRAELDPARPAILTYASIDGKRTLTGAVYALALRPGERPPDVPPSAQWHDHVGTIDEESLLFGHDRNSGSDDLRLVVMHAWLWVANPSGMFATDNWALPFARLGANTPLQMTAPAARAVSLLSDTAGYYERLFTSAGELDERESATVSRLVGRQRDAMNRWWHSRQGVAPISDAELAELHRGWMRLQSDVVSAVRPAAARRLERVFAHH